MTTEIVKARLGHALLIARQLDPARVGQMTKLGFDPRRLIARRFRDSREAWTLRHDGTLVAIGGWSGTVLGGEAEAWLAVTPLAQRRPLALGRLLRRIAAGLLERGITIAALIDESDDKSRRVAMWCGLAPEGDRLDGTELRRYARAPSWA